MIQNREHRQVWFFIFIIFLSIFSRTSPLYPSAPSRTSFAGVVSAATPEAAQAGTEILEAGGNAVDAAVAVSFVLAVTEPAMSGLGGGTQIILQSPERVPVVINGTTYSPTTTPHDATDHDIAGHRAATTPSTVRTLDYAWRTYGSGNVSWEQLLAQAIRYAEEGFQLGPFRHRVLLRHADDLREHPSVSQLFLNPDGSVPNPGSEWKQPVLARTLRRLAENGADDFYSGAIAEAIARDMTTNGGWISLDDLKNFPEPREQVPLRGRYRGYDVYTLPPPCGGWVVLQILNLIETWPPQELALASDRRGDRLIQALRIGHTNRRDAPITDMINYSTEIRIKTSKTTARRLLEQDNSSGETTHFSVVDKDGMTVGVTASVNSYYGAKVASPSLGFVYNNYMIEFELGRPHHPFSIGPNTMPYSSMSATILSKNGIPKLVLGSPGSARIISAVVQVAQLWVDTGIGVQRAVAEPRLHVYPDLRLYIESSRFRSLYGPNFERQGYILSEPRDDLADGHLNPFFGGVHAIAFEDGTWKGTADPRRDGVVRYATQ